MGREVWIGTARTLCGGFVLRIMAVEDRNWDTQTLLVGMSVGAVPLENGLKGPQTTKGRVLI